jgi:hypothetical protein
MEPYSPVDRYIGGHGMSFGLEDQKPQPPQPPQPPSPALGLFFWPPQSYPSRRGGGQ